MRTAYLQQESEISSGRQRYAWCGENALQRERANKSATAFAELLNAVEIGVG